MERFNSFRKVGKYEISNTCLQSYPCKHNIRFENGETKLMSSDKIFSLLKNEGLTDKHFDIYEEFIRKRDFPTPEEIKKRENEIQMMQQAAEQWNREFAEQQKIIDQYKASSRLEKLKMKNNIH